MLAFKTVSALTLAWAVQAKVWNFKPENSGLHLKDLEKLPSPFNLVDSQSVQASHILDYYFAGSLVHTTEGQDFFILSNTYSIPTGFGIYRGAVLDLNHPLGKFPYTYVATNTSSLYKENTNRYFNITLDGVYSFGSTSNTDPISKLHTYMHTPRVHYDLTFETSAPPVMDGGVGTWYTPDREVVYQWTMPAGKVTGTFVANGKVQHVDPKKSLTFYDREWGSPNLGNWTFFGLRPEASHKCPASFYVIWSLTTANGTKQFATARGTGGGIDTVLPVSKVAEEHSFHSKVTGITWGTSWTVSLADGTHFKVKSVRQDSEYTTKGGQNPIYTSVVTFTGSCSGYGFTESMKEVVSG